VDDGHAVDHLVAKASDYDAWIDRMSGGVR
jgi:hypothetical protein